jgi:hypothetical protein
MLFFFLKWETWKRSTQKKRENKRRKKQRCISPLFSALLCSSLLFFLSSFHVSDLVVLGVVEGHNVCGDDWLQCVVVILKVGQAVLVAHRGRHHRGQPDGRASHTASGRGGSGQHL